MYLDGLSKALCLLVLPALLAAGGALNAAPADAALQQAAEAAAAAPQNASLRFRHGLALLDLKRDDEALQVFERLTQDFPELPEPYNNIALLHVRAGRLEPARLALEAALRNDPAHALARRNLGDVYLLLALQAWEAAAEALPADRALQQRLTLARELAAAAR